MPYFTRQHYDPCEISRLTRESTEPLEYMLDPTKHYRCNQCRVEFGVVGGNNVSLVPDNLVDVESELRNQTRVLTRCPEKKYMPDTRVEGVSTNKCRPGESDTGLPCGSVKARDNNLVHLPDCNLIDFNPRINHTGLDFTYPPCPTGKDGQPLRQHDMNKWHKRQFVPDYWQGQQGIGAPY